MLCVGLVAAAAAAGLHYVATAVRPEVATLAASNGIVLVQEPTWPRPGAVHVNQALYSGDVILTDAISTAQINFFDGSTVYLHPGTQVQITRLRANRYSWLSPPRRIIDLALQNGKLEAKVAAPSGNASQFTVDTVGARVTIAEGTTDVWLGQPRTPTNSCCATQVFTQDGSATVTGSGTAAVTLKGEQRTTVPMGGVPLGALAPTWDLLAHGTFQTWTAGLPDGWDWSVDPGSQQLKDHFALLPGPPPTLHMWSAGAGDSHRGIYFRQQLNRDVRDFLRLDLVVSFRINSQSLPGGGTAGSEYPFRVTVDYVGRSGADTQWFHGFYVLPASGKYIVDPQADEVPAHQWYPASADQGVMRLSNLPDPPVYVKYVEFSASGWDFDTDVREVRLLAQ